jgi:hypothetical protein
MLMCEFGTAFPVRAVEEGIDYDQRTRFAQFRDKRHIFRGRAMFVRAIQDLCFDI